MRAAGPTARQMGVTQSALSHQIKAIETHYQEAIFSRRTSPIRWSQAGERLVALGYAVHQAVADADRNVSRIRLISSRRIGLIW
ncbi:MAG: LysR family transcriptional regulator [Verrucomicrobiaceae bacterium]|nr:LysR family transcriptional regulator [Verrucomicrobiaceae bacterium]